MELICKLSFGNRKIATVQSLKFLGLTIDTTLTWKNHIGELTSRMNKACCAIRSINHLTPNGHYMCRNAQLTSRCCILYIYSTNVRTEYFKHAA